MASKAKIYGKCVNESCDYKYEPCYDPEIIDGKPCCPHCGQPLEFPKVVKKPFPTKLVVAIVAVCILAGAVVGIAALVKGVKAKKMEAEIARLEMLEQARQDSIEAAKVAEAARLAAEQEAAEQQAAEEAARLEAEALAAAEAARLAEEEAAKAKKASATPSRAESGRLSYGKWSGSWKSGKPNGTGTMRYTEEHLIDSRDPQKRVAKAGDYIIGEFANGRLVQGVWYDSANNVKGSIIIGM